MQFDAGYDACWQRLDVLGRAVSPGGRVCSQGGLVELPDASESPSYLLPESP